MRPETDPEPDLIDHAADSLLSLIPLYHSIVFRPPHMITGRKAAQYRVLRLLAHHGVRQISEIGRLLSISKPSMTALIDAMIREGLVERQADPGDRRVVLIRITGKGKIRLATKDARFRQDAKDRLARLSDDDLRILRNALRDVRFLLEKTGDDEKP
ncbi:MAG TPA: MarR family transcriptional regulator [Methanoregulaceae archaeon]|nr:MarR family transcriptional regulator [Methanoregulaceae archaeon]